MPFWPVSRSPRPRAATVLRSLLVLVFAALIGVPALSSGQVQIKGKVRHRLTVPADLDAAALEKMVLADPEVRKLIAGKQVRKVIVVPGKLVNIVVGP